MQRAEKAALYILLLGVGATLLTAFVPLAFPDVPRWVWQLGVAIGLLLVVLSGGFLLKEYRAPNGKGRRMIPIFGMLICGAGFCFFAYLALRPENLRADEKPNQADALPDVRLEFVNARSGAGVLIKNTSGIIAKDINWVIVLWNMSDPRVYSGGDYGPDAHEALPIPSANSSYVRPYDEVGPTALFGPYARPFVKQGDVLIGSASITCADCSRGYTYLVYLRVGLDGWYAVDDSVKNGHLRVPTPMNKVGSSLYFENILHRASQLHKVAF